MLRKSIALVLSLSMFISVMPVSIFAQPEMAAIETDCCEEIGSEAVGEDVDTEYRSNDDTLELAAQTVTEAQVLTRINDLVDKLNGKYFTTTQTACKSSNPNAYTLSSGAHSSCDYCFNTNVVATTWFKNMFGNVNVSNFPVTATTSAGWSCAGFGSFAMWYIFKNSNSDKITTTCVAKNVTINIENYRKYAKPGDLVRLNNAHTMIFISANSNGTITWLDCNNNSKSDPCRVAKLTGMDYKGMSMNIYRATNYEVGSFSQSDFETRAIASSGHIYAYYPYALSWTAAKEKCEEFGGHLATITSSTENNNVWNVISAPAWIGAYRNSGSSSYQWVTGESFSYTNWDDGEPSMSNSGNEELYVGIYYNDTDTQYSTTKKWNDFSASTGSVKGFVCEWDPYTVTYNANGGSGAPASQNKAYGVNLALSSTTPTRTGYTFQGWATSQGGSVAYSAGSTFTGNYNLNLYAVWKANTYTVTYNANGGFITPSSQTKTHGVNLTLSYTKPTRLGYTFQGWATSQGGSVAYYAGDIFSGNYNLNLYAVWKVNTYTVTYYANGGTGAPASQTKTHDVDLTLSSITPTRTGYTFRGWATSPEDIVYAYSSGSTFTGNYDLELYAVWKANTSGTCGDNLTWTLDTGTGTLTISGSGDMENNSYTSAPWGEYHSSIKKVVINDGVTSIGSSAFYFFDNLTSITIPDSVTKIDIWAFRYCESLKSITIPDSVTSIEERAFEYCYGLTNITIPGSVMSIGDDVFLGCNSLTSINVDGNNQNYCSIDGNLFSKDKSTLIRYAYGKKDMQYVIPSSVTSIGNSAFSYCKSLTSITIPDSVTNISDGAFKSCESLSSIIIPSRVTRIGNSAFEYCKSLTSITIPDSVTSIGYWAFGGCNSLTSITIPDSKINIGYNIFYGCNNLTIYGYAGSTAETYAKENNKPFVSIGDRAITGTLALTGVTAPVKNEVPVSAAAVTAPENTTVTSVVWSPAHAVFAADTAYGVTVNVKANDGYKFDESVKFTVDGESWTATKQSDGSYNLTKTFQKTAAENSPLLKIADTTVSPSDEFYVDIVAENCSSVKAITINDIECSDVLTLTKAEWLLTGSTLSSVNINGDSLIAFQNAVEANNKAVMRLYFTVDGDATDENAYIRFKAKGTDASSNNFDFVGCNGNVSIRSFIVGDCDGDEKVTVDDAIYLAFYTFYPSRYPLPAGMSVDFDKDGTITVDDAIYLAFHTFYPERYPLN